MTARQLNKVLIDTDPGTDDALALMMALSSPDLDVQGITTVGGNASLADTTRNALRLMEYLGVPGARDRHRHGLPVVKGSARPLNGRFHYGYYFHGPAGLGVRLPSPKTAPHPGRAPEFIARLASESPGQLTLIALGPLTNVARALALDPQLARWTRELVVMGGAIDVPGNVTQFAEFNIYNDPVAANAVVSSGIPTTLVPLDVCRLVGFARGDGPWVEGRSRTAALANRILSSWFKLHPDRDVYDLCDPLALVAAVRPGLLAYEQATVAVPTGGEHLGRTLAAYGSGPVRVAVGVDAAGAKALIAKLLASNVR